MAISDNRLDRKFGKTGWLMDHLRISRNHEHYDRPDTAVNVSVWKDNTGGLAGNIQISRDEALELADHLKAVVASFDTYKPQKLLQQVAKLETGTIFTMRWDDEDYPNKYVRTRKGADEVGSYGGSWELKDFITPSSLEGKVTVVFDPTK